MKQKLSPSLLILIALFAAMILLVSLFASNYLLNIVNTALIYFVGVLGISVLMGMTGYMMLASAAFMGIGAFISANLAMRLGLPVWLSLLLAAVLTGAVGAVIGMALVKLNGAFFAFATLALTQIVATFLINYRPFTGGPDGLQKIPPLQLGGLRVDSLRKWFYVLCAVCLICGLLVHRIRKSRLGRSLESIRDNSVAAETLGVNTFLTKIYAFVIACMLAGFSGALLAHHNSVISASLFSSATSNKFFMMVMVGGVNSTMGAFVGTLIFTFLPEVLRFAQLYINIIYGALIILMMIFMPSGIVGLIKSLYERVLRVLRAGKGDTQHG